MVNTREVDEDGLEKNFATNTLGTYILTTGLIPLLAKHESPRVVTVSSGLYKTIILAYIFKITSENPNLSVFPARGRCVT